MNKASEVEAGEVIGASISTKQFDPEVAKRIKAIKKEARQRKVAQSKDRAASEKLWGDALGHFVVANNQELREVVRQHRREDQLREEQPRRSCEQEGEEWADRIIRQSSAAVTNLPRKKQK